MAFKTSSSTVTIKLDPLVSAVQSTGGNSSTDGAAGPPLPPTNPGESAGDTTNPGSPTQPPNSPPEKPPDEPINDPPGDPPPPFVPPTITIEFPDDDTPSITISTPTFTTENLLSELSMTKNFPEIIGSFDFIPLYNNSGKPTSTVEYFMMQIQSQICAQNIITRCLLPPETSEDEGALAQNVPGTSVWSAGGVAQPNAVLKRIGANYAMSTNVASRQIRNMLLFHQAIAGLRDSLDIKGTSRYYRNKSGTVTGATRSSTTYPFLKTHVMWEYLGRRDEGSRLYSETGRGSTTSLTDMWPQLGFNSEALFTLSNTAIWTILLDWFSFSLLYGSDTLISGDSSSDGSGTAGSLSGIRSWIPTDPFETYNFRENLNDFPAYKVRKALYNTLTQAIDRCRDSAGWGIPGQSAVPFLHPSDDRDGSNYAEVWSALDDFDEDESWFAIVFYSIMAENNVGGKLSTDRTAMNSYAHLINPEGPSIGNTFVGSDTDPTDGITHGGSRIERFLRATISEWDKDTVWDHSTAPYSGICRPTASDGKEVLLFENELTFDYGADVLVDSDMYLGFDYIVGQIIEWLGTTEDTRLDETNLGHLIDTFTNDTDNLCDFVNKVWKGNQEALPTSEDYQNEGSSLAELTNPAGMQIGTPFINCLQFIKLAIARFDKNSFAWTGDGIPSVSSFGTDRSSAGDAPDAYTYGFLLASHDGGEYAFDPGDGEGSLSHFDWGNYSGSTDISATSDMPRSGTGEMFVDSSGIANNTTPGETVAGGFELAVLSLANRDPAVLAALIGYIQTLSRVYRHARERSWPGIDHATGGGIISSSGSGAYQDIDDDVGTLGIHHYWNWSDPNSAALMLSATIIASLQNSSISGYNGTYDDLFGTESGGSTGTGGNVAVMNNLITITGIRTEYGGSGYTPFSELPGGWGPDIPEDWEDGEDPGPSEEDDPEVGTDSEADPEDWDEGPIGDGDFLPEDGYLEQLVRGFGSGWWPLWNPIYNYLLACLQPETMDTSSTYSGGPMETGWDEESRGGGGNMMLTMLLHIDWISMRGALTNMAAGASSFAVPASTSDGGKVPMKEVGMFGGSPGGGSARWMSSENADSMFIFSRLTFTPWDTWIALGVKTLAKVVNLVFPWDSSESPDGREGAFAMSWQRSYDHEDTPDTEVGLVANYSDMYGFGGGDYDSMLEYQISVYNEGIDPLWAIARAADISGVSLGDFGAEGSIRELAPSLGWVSDGERSEINYYSSNTTFVVSYAGNLSSAAGAVSPASASTRIEAILAQAQGVSTLRGDFDQDVVILDADSGDPGGSGDKVFGMDGLRNIRSGLVRATEDFQRVLKPLQWAAWLQQDVSTSWSHLKDIIDPTGLSSIDPTFKSSTYDALVYRTPPGAPDSLPQPVDGVFSQEHLLACLHSLPNFFHHQRSWMTKDPDTSNYTMPAPFFPAGDLISAPGFIRFLTLLKNDMELSDVSTHSQLRTAGRTDVGGLFTSFRAEDDSVEISADDSKRIIAFGLPLGFMETIRSYAELKRGLHYGNDSLIRVNIHKVDLRLDGVTFSPKSFLFDTAVFAADGLAFTELDVVDAHGAATVASYLLNTNVTYNYDKSSVNCYGLSPHESGIINDTIDDDSDFNIDLQVSDLLGSSTPMSFKVDYMRMPVQNYRSFYDGTDTGSGATRSIKVKRYTHNTFRSDQSYFGYASAGGTSSTIDGQDIASAVFFNHTVSFNLKQYLKISLGLNMEESGFYYNQEQIDFTANMGTLDWTSETFGYDFYGETGGSDLSETYGNAYVDSATTLKDDYDQFMEGFDIFISGESPFGDSPITEEMQSKIKNMFQQTTLFGHETYYQRLVLPKVFERTFAVLIDIDHDFEIDESPSDVGFTISGEDMPEDGVTTGPHTFTVGRGSEMYAFYITIDLMRTPDRTFSNVDGSGPSDTVDLGTGAITSW